jgi:hypothetical protein
MRVGLFGVTGVNRLSGHPNGRPLVNQKWCGRLGCEDTKELHGPYLASEISSLLFESIAGTDC